MPPFEVHDARFRDAVERWWSGEARVEAIKETSRRKIWRVDAGGAALIVKRFPRALWRDRAAKEARLLRALADAGIPAPRLVATARDAHGAYLATEEIVGAAPLITRLASEGGAARPLLVKLAGLVRRMHDAGFEHLDLHTGNILARGDDLFVIDVHRARRVARLSSSRRLAGAAFAAMSFQALVPRTEISRFFSRYGLGSPEERAAAWNKLNALCSQFYRRRQKRCLREGTQFGVRKGMRFRKGANLDEVRRLVDSDGLIPVKGSLSRSEGGLFIKRTRRGRAVRIWENAQGLSVRGIGTPRLDACSSSWVVGEWVDGQELYHFIRDRLGSMSREERDGFLFTLARTVRRMHERGVFHRDLKSANVLVRGGDILFVDLDRVVFSRSVPEPDRQFNLAQLNASVTPPLTRTDRYRFLRYYLNRDAAAWRRRKEWAARIMKLTRARGHHWP